MPLRTRIFIIVSIIVLVTLGISLLLINNARKKKNETPASPTSTLNDTSSFEVIDASNFDINKINPPVNTSQVPTKRYTEAEATQHSVVQLAKIFTERYGSYSTDNNSQNIIEVQELATSELWEKIKPATGIKTAGGFKGVSTAAISTELSKWSENEAIVKVKTIRIQEVNRETSTTQQVANVSLVKQGNTWLVNSFAWEN